MAVEIGTASGHIDLAEKLAIFLTTNSELVAAGENWTLLEHFPTRSDGEWIYSAPGLTTTEDIIVEIQARSSISLNYYNWALRGAIGYIPGAGFDGHIGDIDDGSVDWIPYVPFWNMDIPYWFIANGQRVIVVGKVNNTYQSLYLGYIDAYALPSQYPKPLFIGGMSDDPTVGYNHDSHRFFPYGYNGNNGYNGRLLDPSGYWMQADENSTVQRGYRTFPWSDRGNVSEVNKIVPLDSGDTAVLPVILYTYYNTADTRATFGELDGVFWIHGRDQVSETTYIINGETFMVVGDSGGTGDVSFMAIRMV